jgi:signal transduction histidine kinase
VVQEALEKTRSFSQALHPTILDDYGLEKAIERYLPTVEKQSGITVRFEKQGSGKVRDGHAIHIYRILQEALTNVVKHSQSKDASVKLQYSDSLLLLQIEDHGVGIGPNANGGLGLIAMRERAELVGGELAVSRPVNGGTVVRLRAPVVRQD